MVALHVLNIILYYMNIPKRTLEYEFKYTHTHIHYIFVVLYTVRNICTDISIFYSHMCMNHHTIHLYT